MPGLQGSAAVVVSTSQPPLGSHIAMLTSMTKRPIAPNRGNPWITTLGALALIGLIAGPYMVFHGASAASGHPESVLTDLSPSVLVMASFLSSMGSVVSLLGVIAVVAAIMLAGLEWIRKH